EGVDGEARREAPARRDPGIPGRAPAQPPAFLQDGGSSGPVDRSIHPAAAQQAGIGSVHDRLGRLVDDVSMHELDAGAGFWARRHRPLVAGPRDRGNPRTGLRPANPRASYSTMADESRAGGFVLPRTG